MTCAVTGLHTLLLDDLLAPKELEAALRRADEFIKLAMTCVHNGLKNSKYSADASRSGIVLGTAYGPMQTNFEVLDLVVSGQQSSPTLFSHSVFNGAAGYLARNFACAGMSITLTDFAWPFFHALRQAKEAIMDGTLDHCLVLQVDTYSKLLDDIRKQCAKDYQMPWNPGCVLWLLEKKSSDQSGLFLEEIDVQTLSLPGEDYLTRIDTIDINGTSEDLSDPLAPAIVLSKRLIAADNAETRCRISGPYGEVMLSLKKQNSQPSKK